MTFAKLKRDVERRFPGAVLEELDGCAFYLTAPPDHTWDGDLHEFVAEHRSSLAWPRIAADVKSALDDLKGRVDWAAVDGPVPCTNPDCDWCRPTEE